MRKLKTKEKKKEEFDIVKHREQAMLNAQRILEKEDDFKLFAAIIKNSDSMPMPVVTSTAAILASITSASFIKDKNKKAKAENTIRIQATKYLHEIAGELLPNANTHIFMLLLELNEIISDYTEAESKLGTALEELALKHDYDAAKELLLTKTNFLVKPIKEVLGYEPAFTGKPKEKAQDCLNWLSKTMVRMLKYNSPVIIHETLYNSLDSNLEKTLNEINNNFSFTKDAISLFKDETILLKELVTRVKLIKGWLKKLEVENKAISPLEYKKDLSHLKNTLTRIISFFTIIYNLLNYGEEEGESKLNFV